MKPQVCSQICHRFSLAAWDTTQVPLQCPSANWNPFHQSLSAIAQFSNGVDFDPPMSPSVIQDHWQSRDASSELCTHTSHYPAARVRRDDGRQTGPAPRDSWRMSPATAAASRSAGAEFGQSIGSGTFFRQTAHWTVQTETILVDCTFFLNKNHCLWTHYLSKIQFVDSLKRDRGVGKCPLPLSAYHCK